MFLGAVAQSVPDVDFLAACLDEVLALVSEKGNGKSESVRR